MSPKWKRLSVLPALALLATLALPAAAQVVPGDPQPVQGRTDPVRGAERCVAVGTALAVLAGDSTVAKVIGPMGRTAAGTVAGNAVITLDEPAAVGACLQLQGFWADGVAGPAGAHVQLFSANDTSAPLAQNGWRGEHTGPAIENQSIRAVTKIDQPGTYQFVALVTVQAGAPAPTAAAVLAEAKDAKKVPFTVVLRAKGSISGVVKDASGAPIAGAQVRADMARTGGSGGGAVEPPVLAPITLDDGRNPSDRPVPNSAVTDANGAYRIALATGTYRVTAQMRGFKAQWHNMKDTARAADPVVLTPDQPHRSGVDFALTRADPAPQPTGRGNITGLVTDAGGAPIAGASVQAMAGQNTDPAIGASRGFSAMTGADGHYELAVPAGKWLVSARANLFLPQWYKGKPDAASADAVDVADGATVADVSFALAAAPHATLSGVVKDKDGNPMKGATVLAMPRANPANPPLNPAPRGPTAVTDENGAYTLTVAPGPWVVGAAPAANTPRSTAGGAPTLWWNNKTKIEEADLLKLVDGDQIPDINFQFN